MGIELIGEEKPGEVEVIIIAIEAIKSAEIENFKIDIGHIEYLEALLNHFDISEEDGDRIKSLLAKRNIAGFKDYTAKLEQGRVLQQLIMLRGGRECLTEAERLLNSSTAIEAIEELKIIYDFLVDYGVEDYINIDLSMVRNFKYYTGIVFEGFTEKLGYFICGGGRYDSLIEKYSGNKIAAAGCALNIDRIRDIASQFDYQETNLDIMVVFNLTNRSRALKQVKRLQSEGKRVVMKITDKTKIDSEIIKNSKKKGIDRIFSLLETDEQQKIKMMDLVNDKQYYIDPEERLG
jgi:ATP phosphoribosyltransferase regulatory subunit